MLRGKQETVDPTRYQLRLSIDVTLGELANNINSKRSQE